MVVVIVVVFVVFIVVVVVVVVVVVDVDDDVITLTRRVNLVRDPTQASQVWSGTMPQETKINKINKIVTEVQLRKPTISHREFRCRFRLIVVNEYIKLFPHS